MAAGNWKRRRKLIVPGVLALGAVAVWLLYPRTSDRELIENLLRRGEHGVETKNAREIMGCVASDYKDSEYTYSELYRSVLQWCRVSAQAQVTIGDSFELDLEKDRASGTFDVLVELYEQGQRTAVPLHLRITFVKHWEGWHRVWLVRSVEGYQEEGKMMEGMD